MTPSINTEIQHESNLRTTESNLDIQQLLNNIENIELAGYYQPHYYEIFSAYFKRHLSSHLSKASQELVMEILKTVVTDKNLQLMLDIPITLQIPLSIEIDPKWTIITHLIDFIERSISDPIVSQMDDNKLNYQEVFTDYLLQVVFKNNSDVHDQIKEIIGQIVSKSDVELETGHFNFALRSTWDIPQSIEQLKNLPTELTSISFQYTLEWQMICHLINFGYDVILSKTI